MDAVEKLPTSFWVIAGVGLAWNLMGLTSFAMQMTATPEQLAQMYPTEAQQAFVNNVPGWATAAYAIAVIGGVLGCVALLLRRSVAKILFGLSIGGVIVQNGYGFVVANGIEVFGAAAAVLPLLVIAIGVALLLYTGRAQNKGWVT
ncbi:MAG: hypothetical protein AAF660_14145 [Pseudomonadota bacterium]